MGVIGQQFSRYAMTVAMIALPAWAMGESSSVESFTSMVNTGSVKQNTVGADNRQDLNVGSASSTRANSFNATVSTGSITQSSRGSGIVQSANIGSMSNANVNSFNAVVSTGSIEQLSTHSGDRQELDIGSVNNSTVNGAFNAKVTVKDGVRQTDSGEIVLGSVKNSNIQNFSTTLDVKGTVTGNNIRIGSIVGQERFDKKGKFVGTVVGSSTGADNSDSNGFLLPSFGQSDGKMQEGDGRIPTLLDSGIYPKSSPLPLLSYGCYCGPRWTGCGAGDNFNVEPVDSMDRLCMNHDKAYIGANRIEQLKADLVLLSGLGNLSEFPSSWDEKPINNEYAEIYLNEAVVAFMLKVGDYDLPLVLASGLVKADVSIALMEGKIVTFVADTSVGSVLDKIEGPGNKIPYLGQIPYLGDIFFRTHNAGEVVDSEGNIYIDGKYVGKMNY